MQVKCVYDNCQFNNLKCIEMYGNEKEKVCSFHYQDKKSWSQNQRNQFEKSVLDYVSQCQEEYKNIEFVNATFIKINWSEVFQVVPKYISIEFKNCIFLENSRFDNIKCKNLKFLDCRFLDGGSLKNKNKENALDIDQLILSIYELQGDFVVDIGKYANQQGVIETTTGKIENIEFTNQQVGDGRVFFIGLNDKLKYGNFRNRILDNVVFQNSTLERCYFLNSKIDETEFRNVFFPKYENINFSRITENSKEKWINLVLIIFLPLVAILIFTTMNYNDLLDFAISFIFVIFFVVLLSPLDWLYTEILKYWKKIIGHNTTFLNEHLATADEEGIIKKLLKENSQQNVENIKALKALYEQLALNFLKSDKQVGGEFIYSTKFFQSLVDFRLFDFINIFPVKAHHLINGYGYRWFRALWWFLLTVFSFGIIFSISIKPNEDYIATNTTPYFLLRGTLENNKALPFVYTEDNFIVLKKNNSNEANQTFYATEYSKNLLAIKEHKIFALKNNYIVGFAKSISNLYPFVFEGKKWFQNVSPRVVVASFIETLMLWILFVFMVKAVWNRVRF